MLDWDSPARRVELPRGAVLHGVRAAEHRRRVGREDAGDGVVPGRVQGERPW